MIKKSSFFYWFIESLLLLAGVGFHYWLPICFVQVDDKGVWFSENVYFEYLVYFWLAYLPYSLYGHFIKSKLGESSRMEVFIKGLFNRSFSKEWTQIGLLFLVKVFFIPLMFFGTLHYGVESYFYLANFKSSILDGKSIPEIFNFVIYPFIVLFAMFLALLVYLVGYIFESKKYKTTVLSVENTWFGWVVTIICYVPFYSFLAYVFPNASQDFAFYKSQEITFVVRLLLSLILVLKTITIFNLGLRSSNLTYRGLVTTGIYGLIRHPHYAFKLMLWWIGLIPSAYEYPWLIGPMIFWTVIYYLRAVTEEQHLIRNDNSYVAYKDKVKYMFLPKIF
jgi:protein-S-isoprenylcysteine O-methyltransferase Ste14